jgi:hypothetical protein
MTKSMTISEVLAEARRLQAAMRNAASDFFLFLRWIETEREDVWRAGGCETFVGWLTSHAMCEPMQYTEFAVGLGKVARAPDKQKEIARALGADTVRALKSYKGESIEPEKVELLVAHTRAFEEIHERKPGEQTAKNWIGRIQPKVPKILGQASKLRQLEAENQRLRAENRDLERKLKLAESELTKLRKASGKNERAKRQPPAAAE